MVVIVSVSIKQSLARKYRPGSFSELVGQDAAARALTGGILMGRIAQGVILTGVRGVGKTTTARLYAKALNCEQRGLDAEPCGQCGSCLAISRGAHEDVLEIDGASNNGVSEVRALQETLSYVPQRSAYRVFIIDEVHMLSDSAFNALLKTLEEPPAHVVFVMATTHLSKLPATIIGRCQTFHLSKLPVAVIRQRLAEILRREGVEAEDKALGVIAREGHGSMRDALTLLDQAIAVGSGRITLESLGPIVSNLSSTPYIDLLSAFVRKDPAAGVAIIDVLDAKGMAFRDVVEELGSLARHAFVVRELGLGALDTGLLGLDDDELKRLRDLGAQAPQLELNRIFRTLAKARLDLDGSALDRFVFENYFFEWCLDPGLPLGTSASLPQPARAASMAPSSRMVTAPSSQHARGATTNPKEGHGSVPPLSQSRAAAEPAAPSTPPQPAPSRSKPFRAQDFIAELRKDEGASPTTNSSPPAVAAPVLPTVTSAPVRDPGSANRASVPSLREGSQAPEAKPAELTQQQDIAPERRPFPSQWREFIDIFKQEKPIQARKLEDVHPLLYGPDEIRVAVDAESMSARVLTREEQNRFVALFQSIFAFHGRFVVEIVTRRADPESTNTVEAPLPETILTQKAREDADRRRQLEVDTRQGAFAKEALAILGGTIENVIVRAPRS